MGRKAAAVAAAAVARGGRVLSTVAAAAVFVGSTVVMIGTLKRTPAYYVKQPLPRAGSLEGAWSTHKFEAVQDFRRRRIDLTCAAIAADPTLSSAYAALSSPRDPATFVEEVSPFQAARPANLVWCKVPKAGSTTWAHMFRGLQRGEEDGGAGGGGGKAREDRTFIVNVFHSLTAATEKVGDFLHWALEEMTKERSLRMPYSPRSVIVVRDPWERIKSAYKGKLIDQKDYYGQLYPELYISSNHGGGEPVSFAAFLDAILLEEVEGGAGAARRGHPGGNHSLLRGNEHFLPAFGLCDPCRYKYDFIIKVEHLSEETAALCRHLGISNCDLLHLNPSQAKVAKPNSKSGEKHDTLYGLERRMDSSAPPPLLSSVSAAALREFLRLFRPDMELFGYSARRLERALEEKEEDEGDGKA